jgi:hypothetical protein
LEHYKSLLQETSYPASTSVRIRYEELDAIRIEGVKEAERRCRKLCMGQVDFSPQLRLAKVSIYVWTLLLNRAKGGKVSSRLLSHTHRKAGLSPLVRGLDPASCLLNLQSARCNCYSIRASAPVLRKKHLDSLAEALAKDGNLSKEKVLKQLKQREAL